MESSLRHILHFSNPETDQQHHTDPNTDNVNEVSIANGVRQSLSDEANSKKRSAPTSRLSYPRKRAVRACQSCRLRRTKCDNTRPKCSACSDLGAECIYSESDPSTFDPASLTILEKLNAIEELLRSNQSLPATPIRHDSLVVQTPTSVLSAHSAAAPERTIPSVQRRMSIETVLSWPAFRDYGPKLDLKSLLTSTTNFASLSAPINTEFGSVVDDGLIQRFLDNVFIYNPILEEPELHSYIQEVQVHGMGWDGKSCLLLLIHANGALSHSDDMKCPDSLTFRQSSMFARAESYFSAAQKRMGLLLTSSGVLEAQCFFLAGVYLMATLRPLEAWKMFVQALTCCQAFSQDPKLAGEAREREQRLQQSIYWTCFKSELELRLELNVFDNSIWDLTYPAFYPSPPDGLKSQREVVWYYYLAEIALRRLGNRILNFFHKQSAMSIDLDAVIGFEQQAAEWIRSLPSVLSLEVPLRRHGADLVDSLKFILEGHLLDCYEMMYWPFLAEVVLGSSISTTSAPATVPQSFENMTCKSLNVCVERIMKNEHGFFGRHHGTWLMLRSCTRSTLILLAARKDPRLSTMLPSDWRSAVWKVVTMLQFWRSESRDAEDRLRIIEAALRDIGLERHISM